MESVKITVIVHSGRKLASKRHPVCYASVVFGVGKDLYATEVVESNEPNWKQEAVIEVNKPEKEVVKFKVKDKDHTIGVVHFPVKSLTTTPLLQWFELQPHKKGSEVYGEILIELSCNVSLADVHNEDKEVTIQSATTSTSSADEGPSVMSNLKEYFKRPTQTGTRRTSRDENLHQHGMNHYSSDSQLHQSPVPSSSDVSMTYTPNLPKRSFSPDRHCVRTHSSSSWRPRSPLTGSAVGEGLSNVSPPKGESNLVSHIPEVTGISPKQASIEGDQKVILRGSNLGLSLEDVVKVVLVNIDCSKNVEYMSSEKLVITTPKTDLPCRGPVTVVTSSGGEGKSTVLFTFFDPNEEKSPGPPDVTGVSPRATSVSGSEKVTLRGSNLGRSQQDVVLVMLAGVECTSTVEYISSEKLIVTTPPVDNPSSGPVIVETLSGGRNEPTVEFAFIGKLPETHKKWTVESSTVPKTDKQAELKQTKKQLRDAKRENNLLKEKNASLQQYIDVIMLLVMENNPGLLNHELLHQATANLGTTTVDGEVSEDESDPESI